MEYHKIVKLESANLLKGFVEEYMSQFKLVYFNEKLVYTKKIIFPKNILSVINQELQDKGLSKVTDVLSFKRWETEKYNKSSCHLDGYGDVLYDSSIVIPISGCKNTEQYWFDGDYRIIQVATPEGVRYLVPKWIGKCELVDNVTINKDPVLCRVNVPHNTFSNGKEFRLTCTLRLENNETFEEIVSKLSED